MKICLKASYRLSLLYLLFGFLVVFEGAPAPLFAQGASTATTLTVSSSSVAKGTAVTLTASVSSNGTRVDTGIVDFYQLIGNSKILLSSQPLTASAHTAVLKHTFGVGTSMIQAEFQPTNALSASASSLRIVTVTGTNTTTTAIASYGSVGNYTLTGTVSAFGTAAPTGSISFEDASNGNSVLATQPLDTTSLASSFVQEQSCSDHSCAAGEQPYWTASADLNGDGILDLILATAVNTTNLDLFVYLGVGDGTFTTPTPYSYFTGLGNAIMFPSLADVNQDGFPDLVLPMYSSSRVGIMLGDGLGHFGSATYYSLASGANPFAVAVADFNRDGIADLAVANYGDGTVSMLMGNGDGTFQSQVSTAVGTRLNQIAAADLNGDGKIDVVAVDNSTGAMYVVLGNGDGTLQSATSYSTGGTYATSVVIADFNEDGSPDIAVAAQDVVVFLNNGSGSFSSGTAYSAGGDLWQDMLTLADFNMDGHLDLAVTNANAGSIGVLLGKGNGTFSPATLYSTPASPQYLAAGDFNQDGRPDLAFLPGTLSVSLGVQTETATVDNLAIPGASGTHNVLASYAGNTSYSASVSATTALSGPTATTLTLASTAITASPGDTVTLTGTLSPAGANATAADFQLMVDSAIVPATISYANGIVSATYSQLTAGSHAAALEFGGTAQYHSSVSNTADVEIVKIVPTITWTAPAAITYGTALSTGQLNASASVGGSFVYSPESGSVLPAGDQILSVTFNPTDTSRYSTAVRTVQLLVNKAAPQVAWSAPAAIVYGTALSAAQLDATASVAGSFSYSPAAATVLAAGNYTLTANFSPVDSGNYASATANAILTVTKAATSLSLLSSAPSAIAGQAVTLTSTVQPLSGSFPSGTVSFYDGNLLLGTSAVSNGQASVTAGNLSTGSHAFASVYSGDGNFLASSTTSAVTVVVSSQDFVVTGSSGTQTVVPGKQASYSFSVAPASGTFTSPVSFSLSGLPAGATYSLSPSSFAAGTTGGPVVLSIQTANTTTAELVSWRGGTEFALVLLPLFAWKRKGKWSSEFPLLLVISTLLLGGLSGCGAKGTFAQAPKDYSVTLTAVSGTLTHTTTFTLNVQ